MAHCEICRTPLPDTTGKRGRPRETCGAICGAVRFALGSLEDLLTSVPWPKGKRGAVARAELRRRLWSIAALMNPHRTKVSDRLRVRDRVESGGRAGVVVRLVKVAVVEWEDGGSSHASRRGRVIGSGERITRRSA